MEEIHMEEEREDREGSPVKPCKREICLHPPPGCELVKDRDCILVSMAQLGPLLREVGEGPSA